MVFFLYIVILTIITAFAAFFYSCTLVSSAVHGPAWPESRRFGLARASSGFVKPQAQAAAFEWKNTLKLYIYSTLQCSQCCLYFMSTSLSAVSSLAFSWPFLLGRVDVCVPKKNS